MLKRILCLLTLTLLASTFVFSQVTTSSMTGSVKGTGGQLLGGATIVAVHEPSGTRYTGQTQNNGTFNIPNMRPGGPYHVEVSYVGYTTQKFDDINLQLAEAYILNVNLQTAQGALENVVVTTAGGRNSVLNANRTGATTNIGRREIQTLPSITRSINDLTRLTPQANGTSIGGGNYRQNFITVDGSDFNNNFGIGTNLPAGGSPISLDALDEISVSVSPYDIRQSGFIGSAVNAVTRSGTNRFQGSVYRYWRSEKQQGDEVNGTKFIRTPFDFEQYGARIGGPIIKNKLFFFLNYETENQPRQVQNRVASRPGAGFGSAPNIARPTADSLAYISNYLQTTYGYETGPYDNYNTQIERTKMLARIDWNINEKHRFNIRYNQVEGGEPNPPSTSRSPMTGYTTGQGRTDNNALWFKNSNYFQGSNFYSLAGELNSRFGKFSNVFRGTYTFQNDSRESDSKVFPFVDILSFGTPYTSFGYEPFTSGNLRKVKTYSFVDNLTFTLGKHNILAGVQFETSKTINGFQRFATSYYTFATWNDFVSGAKPLDFGVTYSLDPKGTQAFPSFQFNQYSAYIQDEITLNQRFRLTAGLRADLPTYPGVSEIKTHPLVDSLTFPGNQKINTGNLPKSRVMLSPRIGFNWDVNGDRSLQIRGGSGIFTGRIPFVWIVSQSGDAGLLQFTQTYETTGAPRTSNNPTLYATPGGFNPDPNAYVPTVRPAAGTAIPSTITAMDPDFKFPQTWKTSLAMDRKIANNLILSVEAIFNKDLNTTIFTNPNLVAPKALNVAGYPDNRLIYPQNNTDKFVFPLTSGVFNATTNPRPSYPVNTGDARGTGAFNPIVITNGNKGYSFFGTVRLERQFSKGWGAQVAYTKAIGQNLYDGGGDQPLSAWQGTASVNGANYPVLGNASFVTPDRVIAAVSYRKEYFKHLATTISIFYEGGSPGRYSYTYTADINRDGTNFDLIYVPKDPTEITFVPSTINGVTYTAQQQSDMFFRYIEQDKYLRKRKGMYAERNGARLPWRNQFDVKVLQDLFVNIGKNRNTIQFSLDIFNFANLLNSKWGIYKTVNTSSILVPTNQASLVPGGTTRPTFRLATDRNHPVTETYRDNLSITSTYFMQFGIRYLFN